MIGSLVLLLLLLCWIDTILSHANEVVRSNLAVWMGRCGTCDMANHSLTYVEQCWAVALHVERMHIVKTKVI